MSAAGQADATRLGEQQQRRCSDSDERSRKINHGLANYTTAIGDRNRNCQFFTKTPALGGQFCQMPTKFSRMDIFLFARLG
jgi:hypothetical protein